VDKLEVMCAIILASKIANQEKIHYFFELFNFNNKGYLYESEITLLLLAITRGAYKVDQKYYPPPLAVITKLAKEALTNAAVDTTLSSLRKPELIIFALRNKDVLAFLETWRGHASQVLLRGGTRWEPLVMWRDRSFPCNHASIAPSKEWLRMGMPPSEFVRWRRRSKIGTYLFSHKTDHFKTIDRKVFYTGEGILGRGSFRQGVLANRYLLNALAALTSRPELLLQMFATTKQEDNGRFSVRFFEASGWRSVYIDDRVPCAVDGTPIFCRSSDMLETWPMLVEKAAAKYLGGSYGHVALCSRRSDATLFALRLLTGGHVSRLFTCQYDWQSVSSDVPWGAVDGAEAVRLLLEEGSVVSLGSSECRAMMTRTAPSKVNSSGSDTTAVGVGSTGEVVPPFGRLFPAVAVHTARSGFKFLILRDAWGLMSANNASQRDDVGENTNTAKGVDPVSGHSNTFMVAVEDVPRLFDCLVVSRFPDMLRAKTQQLGIPQWETNLFNQVTKGPSQPARFRITVENRNTSGSLLPSTSSRRKKYVPPDVNEVILASDELLVSGAAVSSEIAQYKLKDRVDFSRHKSTIVKKEKVLEEGALGSEEEKRDSKHKQVPSDADLVDVALTISSSCDWIVSGSDICNPKLRCRLVPSPATAAALAARDDLIEQHKQLLEQQAKSRKAALAARLALEKSSIGVSTAAENTALETKEDQPIATNEGDKSNVDPTAREEDIQAKHTKSFDMLFTAECSWTSHSLRLLPGGEYCLLADISFDVPYPVAFQLSLPKTRSETPWFDFYQPPPESLPTKPSLKGSMADGHSVGIGGNSVGSHNKSIANSITFSMLSASSSMKRVAEEIKRLSAADTSIDHNIWLQTSSLEKIHIEAFQSFSDAIIPIVNNTDKSDAIVGNKKLDKLTSIEDIVVPPEKGPFMSESQFEVSSRELSLMLTKMKEEAVIVGAELVNLTSKYKETRKVQMRKMRPKK